MTKSSLVLFNVIAFSLLFHSVGNTTSTKKNQEKVFELSNWQLVWQDEFDGSEAELDKNWDSQNAPSLNLHGSRWRENVAVSNGIVELINKKEKRGGQNWTSGSIRTKKQFGYGYYEARYKYAGASATNNSFWLMSYPFENIPEKGKKFEIDINEGHYPNEVNTNIHNWSDITVNAKGIKVHPSSSKTLAYGTKHHYSFLLEIPISTQKIRFSSNNGKFISIRKFNIFDSLNTKNRTNLSQDKSLSVKVSGHNRQSSKVNHLLDNSIETSWISQEEGEKWIEFTWDTKKTIEEIEFVNGWKYKNKYWKDLITDYKIQYFDNGHWRDIATLDIKKSINFSEEFHTYGLQWNKDEIIFYFDGKEIRHEKNEFAHSLSPIWLSLALIKWDGPLTDKVIGTSMKVDYVRYYQPVK